MLRFLCCTDTHGETPPPGDERNATAWLHAGDICNAGASIHGGLQIKRLANWTSRRTIPAYAVQGNHDCGFGSEKLGRFAKDVTGKVVNIAPHLFLAGIGWSGAKFFDVPDENALEPVCQQVVSQAKLQLAANDRCILLTHYPPRISALEHKGEGQDYTFQCVKNVVDELKPLAVVYGHIHSRFNSEDIYETDRRRVLIVNPGLDGGELSIDIGTGETIYRQWLGGSIELRFASESKKR